MNTNGKMQIFYGVDNPQSIKKPIKTGNAQTDSQGAPHVTLPPQSNNPIIKVVETLCKVDTTSPEAKLNKDSMKDSNGGRITFNDELARSQTFKGVEDPTRLPNKKP